MTVNVRPFSRINVSVFCAYALPAKMNTNTSPNGRRKNCPRLPRHRPKRFTAIPGCIPGAHSESDSAGKPRLVRLENLWPRNPVKPNSKSRGSTCQRWAGRQRAGINRSEVEDERALRERSSHPLGLKFGAGQAPIDARRSSNSGARAPRNSRLGPPRTTPTGAHPAAGASPRVKRTQPRAVVPRHARSRSGLPRCVIWPDPCVALHPLLGNVGPLAEDSLSPRTYAFPDDQDRRRDSLRRTSSI